MKKPLLVFVLLPLFFAAGCGDEKVAGPAPAPVKIIVSPDTVRVHHNESAWFRADVVSGGYPGCVVWSIDGKAHGDSVLGTVTPAGRYTAPAYGAPAATIAVRARCGDSPSGSDTAWVVLSADLEGPSIRITPFESVVGIGEILDLYGEVENVSDATLGWFIDEIPGVSDVGQFIRLSRYQAPSHVDDTLTVFVRAVSREDTLKSAVAIVHVLPHPRWAVTLSPDSALATNSESVWFQASVEGPGDTTLLWTVDGIAWGDSAIGTISPSGRYTAPWNIPYTFLPLDVTVRAACRASPSVFDSALVRLSPGAGSGISVRTSPFETEIGFGQSVDLVAHLQGAADPAVTWSVDEIPGMADAGQVDPDGIYTAPFAAKGDSATVLVRATSVEDPSRSGVSIIHLVRLPIEVHLAPTTAVVGLGQDLFFEFSVENAADTGLDWYVNEHPGGTTSIGNVYDTGRYRAPLVLPDPPEVEVRAVSREDPTRIAVASVEIVPPLKFEAENFSEANDRGGVAIGTVSKATYGASSGYAVEGLDRVLEWIDVPIQIDRPGTYMISFRHASDFSVRAEVSIPGCGPEGQDGEWIFGLNAGGCG